MVNGIIIQRKCSNIYKGVEGDNWYLNDKYPEIFEEYFDENVEKAWYDDEFVDVINDESIIKKYIELSHDEDIEFRLILCETIKKRPCFVSVSKYRKIKFLGYDYAYTGGSYYSAVYNEICLGSFDEFKHFELNENGLLQNEDEVINYIRFREKMISCGKNLELGDFIIYRLYEVELETI
ncbi:MAG: hypothetical protein K5769_04585 [Pseudobutyrivibrio sp.]|nr:hypothetical protein [Pseudobutyrivibrio sp.]